jgi:hypothetical protein
MLFTVAHKLMVSGLPTASERDIWRPLWLWRRKASLTATSSMSTMSTTRRGSVRNERVEHASRAASARVPATCKSRNLPVANDLANWPLQYSVAVEHQTPKALIALTGRLQAHRGRRRCNSMQALQGNRVGVRYWQQQSWRSTSA